jgi:hypothetical protein
MNEQRTNPTKGISMLEKTISQNANEDQPLKKEAGLTSLHHSFDTELAAQYGIEEAILIHHFQHWIAINQRLGRNLIEGRTWTYQTIAEIAAHFSYIKVDRVRRLLESLTEQGVIIKGKFDKNPFNHTTYYAFVDEDIFIPNKVYERQICQNGKAELPKENWQNCPNADNSECETNLDYECGTNFSEKEKERKKVTKKEEKEKTHAKKDREREDPAPQKKKETIQKQRFGDYVVMRPNQYEALCTELGKEIVDSYIESINLWVPNNKPYKDYPAAIRQWEKRDRENGKQKIPTERIKAYRIQNEAFVAKVNNGIRLQKRIPTTFEVQENRVLICCPSKDFREPISLIMDALEFKVKMKEKLESLGFDTNAPASTGYLPQSNDFISKQLRDVVVKSDGEIDDSEDQYE